MDTYWLPLSLWCTSPPRWTGRRSCGACSSASSTKPACAVRETRQPEPVRGRAKPDPWDAPRKDVDDEGDIDETGPRRDVGKVGHPQGVRTRRFELPIDVIERTRGGRIA